MEENTEQRVDLTLFSEKIQELKDQIASVIVGQEQTVDLVLAAILANGHVLIEGVPGVAKTLLARLTARLIDADFSRIQFTPDLMPSDVLGTTVFNMKTNDFDFHQGPIFADIVLVDEINRAPAKTQAALFEVMEERQISIDGITHKMGELYTILATQNPVEQEGTYKLPEAQLDRFLMKITMDYPSLEEEVDILERHHTNTSLIRLDDIKPAITKEELLSLRAFMNQVFVDRTLLQYIALIVQQAFRGMTLLDYAINASLVLSYVAMRKEDKAGLVTFDEHFDTFVPASKQPGHMQTLLEKLYSQQTTFGETDFSALCVHLNKHVNKRSFLVLYTNFASISSMNRQLAYLQRLNRQHRLLVVFFEDADLKAYIESPARDTEDYYRHVIAEKFAFEKRLIVSTLKQHGIYSLLTTPENLSIDVINKYLEMKSRQLL